MAQADQADDTCHPARAGQGEARYDRVSHKRRATHSCGPEASPALAQGHIVVATGSIVIYVVIALTVLSLFGVDIKPILASVRVVGLAIRFGAQSLVKDFFPDLSFWLKINMELTTK